MLVKLKTQCFECFPIGFTARIITLQFILRYSPHIRVIFGERGGNSRLLFILSSETGPKHRIKLRRELLNCRTGEKCASEIGERVFWRQFVGMSNTIEFTAYRMISFTGGQNRGALVCIARPKFELCLKRYILRQLRRTRCICKYHVHRVNVRNRNKIERLLDSHYYCLELVLYCMFLTRHLGIIVQYFILLVGQNK